MTVGKTSVHTGFRRTQHSSVQLQVDSEGFMTMAIGPRRHQWGSGAGRERELLNSFLCIQLTSL
jgi:hypothetical protein